MKIAAFILVLIGALLFTGCGDGSNDENSPGTYATEGVPVEIITINTVDIVNTVDATGAVSALYDADVSAETSGRVVSIPHDVGSRVEKGDAVIQLDDAVQRFNLQQSDARLKIAKAALTKAEKDLGRMEDLFANEDISQNDIEQARLRAEQARGEYQAAEAAFGLAKKALDDVGIAAPFNGEVTATYVDVGEMVSPGLVVYTIVEVDTAKIKVDISASDIGKLRDGLPVEVYVTALPDETFHGEVSAVAVKANEMTRTFAVEILVENLDHRLRPGMLASVRIIIGSREGVIAVPLDAVLKRDGNNVVFVEQEGRAIERNIEISSELGEEVVISSGLAVGDHLIVVGQHNLEDGRKVLVTD